MTPLSIVAGLALLTSILLCIVAAIWFENYRQFRTPLALGLLAFCLVLLLENLVVLYFHFGTSEMLFIDDPAIIRLVVVMRILEFLAVAAFTYVSFE